MQASTIHQATLHQSQASFCFCAVPCAAIVRAVCKMNYFTNVSCKYDSCLQPQQLHGGSGAAAASESKAAGVLPLSPLSPQPARQPCPAASHEPCPQGTGCLAHTGQVDQYCPFLQTPARSAGLHSCMPADDCDVCSRTLLLMGHVMVLPCCFLCSDGCLRRTAASLATLLMSPDRYQMCKVGIQGHVRDLGAIARLVLVFIDACP